MRVRTMSGVLAVVLLSPLAAGCARLDNERLQQARETFEVARKAGAEDLAPAQWETAKAAMDAAETELTRLHEEVPAPLRNYRHANELIALAHSHAIELQSFAETRAKQEREQTRTALGKAQANLRQAKAAIEDLEKCRRKPAALRESLDALDLRLADQGVTLEDDEVAEAEGPPLAARILADDLASDSADLLLQIEEWRAGEPCK